MQTIFVTGGSGYIGSHACIELLNAGYNVVIYDNFSNSRVEVIGLIEKITSRKIISILGDIRDEEKLTASLKQHNPSAVIHFAGLKAVGESVTSPIDYYDNNVNGSISLLKAMKSVDIKKLIFSSSATVYGEPRFLPITEDHPLAPTSPYGRTKFFIEEILRDVFRSDPLWIIGILRYFNPVGAHESGLIGEDPLGIPNNLMPIIAQVAVGRRQLLKIFGADYPTKDGTGVRDYIHVVDLAVGHVKALSALQSPQCIEINLGTGRPHSVLEIINTFEHASRKKIPYDVSSRRNGDVAICFAEPTRATKILGWNAEKDLEVMCSDTWRFQCSNSNNYD